MSLLSDINLSEEEDIGGESSDESDQEIVSNHESDSEQELEEDEGNHEIQYIGKDGTTWRKDPFPRTRTPAENIFVNVSKVTSCFRKSYNAI